MQGTTWRWITILALALGVLVAAGCGDDDDEGAGGAATTTTPAEQRSFAAGTTMAELQEAGEIKIGVKYDVPPFGFKNPETNAIEGFDIDIGKAIATELGVKPTFIEAISDNRIPFLKDGTADLILSTMTINAERDEEIDFSEPYFIARGRILVKKDNNEIKDVKDLAGKEVCTVLGSTYEETLKKQAPTAKRRLVDTYSECLELIQNGAVDAESTDDVILTGHIIQDDELKLVGKPLTTEPYGAGLKEGDTAFKEFVDETIQKFKDDGRWKQTYDKWIGRYTGEDQEPPTMTLKEAIDLTK
ncbi:MAG TPA: glutamate ABC transporter substrate-binding protein [Solirubrobacteraceae bacterium]|nr:glutamate ABC transporter substrate-binding protein [Solirubrobacteraceae bacterium]